MTGKKISELDAALSVDGTDEFPIVKSGQNYKATAQQIADFVSAGAGSVTSVNGQTGTVTLDADDIDDTATTNKFVTSSDLTNLSNLSGTNTGDQDLSGLVPYTGATSDVNIGAQKVIGSALQANSSGGVALKTNGGTDALHAGSGGSANGTLYGGWNLDGGTANTILSLGASKTLTSLSTATYPSLTELSYVKGVTSAIQTQIDAKQATITGGATTITSSNLTASRALVSDGSGKVSVSSVTATEQGYLSGVTSAIQTQLSGKASTGQTFCASGSILGTVADATYTIGLKMAFGGTITETTTKCTSGTATATFKINTTALGGTANSVSSSEQSQAHASANAFVAGDDIVVTLSGSAALTDFIWSIKYTRSLS